MGCRRDFNGNGVPRELQRWSGSRRQPARAPAHQGSLASEAVDLDPTPVVGVMKLLNRVGHTRSQEQQGPCEHPTLPDEAHHC